MQDKDSQNVGEHGVDIDKGESPKDIDKGESPKKSIFQRLDIRNTLFGRSKKDRHLIPEDFHEGTTVDKLKNLYCAMASSMSFGIAIGCAFILYWKYNNNIQTVGTVAFGVCVVVLFFMDMLISTTAPLFIAWYGYGPVAIACDIGRQIFLFLAWTYFLPDPPLPHYMFTFFIGGTCLCSPLFLIGATCVDSWLFARYPKFRLIGNFVPLVISVSFVAVSNISIYLIGNDCISYLCMACLSVSITSLEIYFYTCKGYFHEPHDENFTISDFMTMMKGFFSMELVMKAWTSDAILAVSWVSFSWYYPIFAVTGDESVDDIALAVVAVGCVTTTVGMISVVGYFMYCTWGVTNDDLLVAMLLKGHIGFSWFSKIIYVLALIFVQNLYWRLAICGFSLGQSLVTPSSLIMILSVSPNEIIPYTSFAQISFTIVSYGGSLWLNFYAEDFPDFATAFALLIVLVGTVSLGLLSAWIVYELYYITENDPSQFEIRRKTQAYSMNFPQNGNLKLMTAISKYRGSRHSVDVRQPSKISYNEPQMQQVAEGEDSS